ncbi:hypothetical protein OROMI_015578 [Orobanche minor]
MKKRWREVFINNSKVEVVLGEEAAAQEDGNVES